MMTIQIMKDTFFPPTVGHTRETTESTEPSPNHNHLQMEHLRQKTCKAL